MGWSRKWRRRVSNGVDDKATAVKDNTGPERPEPVTHQPGVAVVAGAVGVVVDLGAAYLIWLAPGGGAMFALGILAHLAAAALIGLVLWRLWRPGGAGMGASVGVLTAVSVPPLGAILIAGMMIWYASQDEFPQFVSPVAEDTDEGGKKGLLKKGRISVSDLIKADTEVQPLVDILHSGDLQLKASAIDVMARLQGRQLVKTMRGLLRAPESDVRFQASVGLSRLEGTLSNAIVEAKAAANADRDSAEKARLLGGLYLDYAFSGLLDETTAGHYATMALEQLQRGEALEPSVDTAMDQARCQMLTKQYRELLSLLEKRVFVPAEQEPALLLKLEAFYALGEYHKLREEASRAANAVFQDPNNEAIVKWWAAA